MSPLISLFELQRKGLETMKEYAQLRGVEYQPFGFLRIPKLLRTYRGCPVEYYLKSESNGTQNGPPVFTTHIRASFPNSTDFTASIIRRIPMARLLNKHGRHSAETGDADFDERFSVRSSDPDMTRQLLSDPEYRTLLRATTTGLSIDDKKEDGLLNRRSKDAHYVKFFVYSYITEIEEVDKAFALVDRTLDRLALLGQAQLPS
jgi:hypothetical protein